MLSAGGTVGSRSRNTGDEQGTRTAPSLGKCEARRCLGGPYSGLSCKRVLETCRQEAGDVAMMMTTMTVMPWPGASVYQLAASHTFHVLSTR